MLKTRSFHVVLIPALTLTFALAGTSALAGQKCDSPQPPQAETVIKALTLAENTMHRLNSSGAKVVLLARAGQDLSKYNLKYSHLGFAYRQDNEQGDPVWRVVHKLNQCGTAKSDIYRQGLGNFFMDDLWRYEATWVAPTVEIQNKLLPVLLDDPSVLKLHHEPYSMVSYAWGTKYQQSNQWALETLAMAMLPNTGKNSLSREQAHEWLRTAGYEPSPLIIGPLTRLGGRTTKANIAFDDHPNEKRFSDRIETVTVDSVFNWMKKSSMGQVVQ